MRSRLFVTPVTQHLITVLSVVFCFSIARERNTSYACPERISKHISRQKLKTTHIATQSGWSLERVCFGVQDPVIEAYNVRLSKQEVVVLESLCKPETLHLVLEAWLCIHDVVDSRVGEISARVAHDGLPHGPSLVLPCTVSRNAIHVPYGLDSFRTENCKRRIDHENQRRNDLPEDVWAGHNAHHSGHDVLGLDPVLHVFLV